MDITILIFAYVLLGAQFRTFNTDFKLSGLLEPFGARFEPAKLQVLNPESLRAGFWGLGVGGPRFWP